MIVGRIEDVKLTSRIGYQKVYEPTVRALTVFNGSILGEVGENEANLLLDELLATLARGEADVVHMPHMVAEGPLFHAARSRPHFLARQHGVRLQRSWHLLLPDSMEEFLGSLSPHARKKMRYQSRRLEREYGETLKLEIFRDRDQLDRLFDDAEQVATKTYQWQLGVAFRDTPLQRGLTELAMDRGWFRAYVLYLEGRPVAYWHGSGYRGVFHVGIPAYDPALANLSVGTYVLMQLIADLCADDSVTELDYGFGDADYKRRFGEEQWLQGNVLIFAPSFRAARINLVITTLSGIDTLARRILGRQDVAGRLKRAWRRRLSSGGTSARGDS